MAAAEVRAAWQRTANRCFVQEDAKRAPKLACCPSASASSKKVDLGPTNAADGDGNPAEGFMPFNINPPYSNLSPESRWWLQLQPNYGHQRGLTGEQLNTSGTEMETFKDTAPCPGTGETGVHKQNIIDGTRFDDHSTSEETFSSYRMIFGPCVEMDIEGKGQGLKMTGSKDTEEPFKVDNIEESYELLKMELEECSLSKKSKELCFSSESPWGSEKTEPWWRMVDGYDLASFVAQRSLDVVENCDLPSPLNTHLKRDPYAYFGCPGSDRIPSSKDQSSQKLNLTNSTVHSQGSLSSGSASARHWAPVEEQSPKILNKQNSDGTICKDSIGKQIHNDPSKAHLLDALLHSQTRARVAEKAAQQAYAEKEHILKLFFRQASHLFAYKQWFQLLQLENLYFQIKNNHQPISTLFTVALPWVPHQPGKQHKRRQNPAKGNRGRQDNPRHNFSKFTFAIALGFGLVGAGLLLGWTVGWMLPAL